MPPVDDDGADEADDSARRDGGERERRGRRDGRR